jgi:hypothetical protein
MVCKIRVAIGIKRFKVSTEDILNYVTPVSLRFCILDSNSRRV